MIVMKLQGGLGNQMFQYSFGKRLQLKYGIPMVLDLSFLHRRDLGPNFTYRDYNLDIFQISGTFLKAGTHISRVFREPDPRYSDNLANIFDNFPTDKTTYFDGYWQCDKYFSDIAPEVKGDFTFRKLLQGKEKVLLDEILETDSVAIHIRRTDYLNTNLHGVCGVDYVNKAINHLLRFIPDPKFYIFSDDLKWCMDNLRIGNAVFVNEMYAENRFDIHLQLMINCKHFIISNSSFSWWAAWLSENKNKIVIAPQRWFANGMQTDIVHAGMNWVRL